jgi:hypothetical protein
MCESSIILHFDYLLVSQYCFCQVPWCDWSPPRVCRGELVTWTVEEKEVLESPEESLEDCVQPTGENLRGQVGGGWFDEPGG